jgi:hypothetical protein
LELCYINCEIKTYQYRGKERRWTMGVFRRDKWLGRLLIVTWAIILVATSGYMNRVPSAHAATPESGTVSQDQTSVTYTGGPYALPNVSGATGPVQCDATDPCDNFTLNVNTPASYGTDHQLKVSINWSNSAADFDLYVLDSNGNEIASSASSSDPETVVLPPNTGTYTVRVVPYAPLNETFTGTIQLVDKPANPAPSTAVAPGFANYAAPDSLANAHNAGEPSIGVDWKTGSVLYQAYTSTYRVKFDDSTSPSKATWSDKSASPPNCTAADSLDPILYTDSVTGRTFESELLANPAVNSLTCYSNDDGDNWTVSEGGGVGSGVDHQTIGGGPFAKVGLGAITAYPDAVYYCSQDIATALCSVSRDGGLTFQPAVPIYTLEQCGGLHGHVKVGPEGTVYVPNESCSGHQGVAVSEDNGQHWTVRTDPDSTPAQGSDPSVGVGANGSVYFAYQNSDGHARASVSTDHGESWVNDQDIGAQVGIQNSVFPTTVAGDNDRAAVAFLGTTTGGDYQATDFAGVWDLYVSVTYDGGKTWKTTDVTPNDPVQRGPICTGGTGCSGSRNLLDFIGSTVDKTGHVLVGYADGCTGSCVAGGANTGDALASIARQTSGLPLFSQYDPKPDLTASSLTSSLQGSHTTTLSTRVQNLGKADAKNVGVRFYNGTTPIGDSAPIPLGAGDSQTVSISWYYGKLTSATITAVIDPDQAISESDESNNKTSANIKLK